MAAAPPPSDVKLSLSDVLGWFPAITVEERVAIITKWQRAMQRNERTYTNTTFGDQSAVRADASLQGLYEALGHLREHFQYVCAALDDHLQDTPFITPAIQPSFQRPAKRTRRADQPPSAWPNSPLPLEGGGQARDSPHVLAPACSDEDQQTDTSYLCPDANNSESGLAQARRRKKKEQTRRVQDRRDKLKEHLLNVASDGQPISVRTLYDTFRAKYGLAAEQTCSAKLRTALEGICNQVIGVEYFILKQQDEDDRRIHLSNLLQQTRRGPSLHNLGLEWHLFKTRLFTTTRASFHGNIRMLY